MSFERVLERGLRLAYQPAYVNAAALRDPERWIAAGQARRSADTPGPPQGGRGRFFVFPAREGTLLGVRHYQRGGLFGPLLGDRYLDGGRALHELDMLSRAAELGVETLRPVAAVSLRRGLVWRHYLATVFLTGSRDLAEQLAGEGTDWQALVEEAGRAIGRLHARGFEHQDLNLRNLLVTGQQVRVIDFDRIRHHPEPLADNLRARALLRLDRSVRKLGLSRVGLWSTLLRGYAPEPGLARQLAAAGLE